MPPSSSKVQEVKRWRVLNREYMERSDGRQYSRKINPKTEKVGEWEEVLLDRAGSSSNREPKILYLVLQRQAPGERNHWSLFACRGESVIARGRVWQAKGDAIHMRYQHAENIAIFGSKSYKTSYALNLDLTESQEKEIEEAVRKEPPPSAKDQRSVKETCQAWAIRVLRRLEKKGIVKKETVDWIESDVKEPIRR